MKPRTHIVISMRFLTHDEWLVNRLWGGQWRLLRLDCGHYLVKDRPLSRAPCKQCDEGVEGGR